MEDIKVIEPKQEIVDIPKFETYFLPFIRKDKYQQWSSASSSAPNTIEGAESCFKDWGEYEKIIIKIQLPIQYSDGTE